MVKLFEYKNGQIKVLWNEQPMIKDYEYSWHKEEISTKTYKVLKEFFIGLEAKINRGGRICYGMLAAKVQPYDKKDIVKISVATTHKNTIHYEKSILFDDAYVYKGLPEEYIEQMNSSIVKIISEKERYPQCAISFEDAINCEVGSSSILFGIIAGIIVDLICTSTEDDMLNMSIEDFTKQYISQYDFLNLKMKV